MSVVCPRHMQYYVCARETQVQTILFGPVLGTELAALDMLGKHCITEPRPQLI